MWCQNNTTLCLRWPGVSVPPSAVNLALWLSGRRLSIYRCPSQLIGKLVGEFHTQVVRYLGYPAWERLSVGSPQIYRLYRTANLGYTINKYVLQKTMTWFLLVSPDRLPRCVAVCRHTCRVELDLHHALVGYWNRMRRTVGCRAFRVQRGTPDITENRWRRTTVVLPGFIRLCQTCLGVANFSALTSLLRFCSWSV